MSKKLPFLLALLAVSFYSKAQTPNWDSLFIEAAKTEVYTQVLAIVTPGASPQDAPSVKSQVNGNTMIFSGRRRDSMVMAVFDHRVLLP